VSPKLPVVISDDAARVARRLGFELRRQKGSYAISEDKPNTLLVANSYGGFGPDL